MFDGFTEWHVSLPTGQTLHGRSGGSGPAVVLLHGHPRAHTTWCRVAPALAAQGWFVVCPDLRGYGRSSKPDPLPDHSTYSDRAMAEDVAALMDHFEQPRFAVVGHDRGQGVAYRTALDHAPRVTGLGILDGIPLLESAERTHARFATLWWHWFFYAGSPHAERVVTADPDAWYGLGPDLRRAMGAENYDYVAAALHDPLTVRAMIEDYRAGLSVDLEHDRQTRRDGRTVDCPLLVAWSVHDDLEQIHGDPTAIWRSWASGPITGQRIDSGHHMAEENPDQLTAVLAGFLAGLT
ncbi:alpha/beta fold hydrolase [Nakamurella endophytica]|uniref:Hydrolase n=1 Tax=Nakamurella endophytica TaxID=1748367 RepID=A0A917T3U6_9ACTN|nr:alpha/beta hydrolase [Nakamurella endophytica]GGM08749.1 hydrolase [Nakamurella endophytica]